MEKTLRNVLRHEDFGLIKLYLEKSGDVSLITTLVADNLLENHIQDLSVSELFLILIASELYIENQKLGRIEDKLLDIEEEQKHLRKKKSKKKRKKKGTKK